jgi:hypothetical protein
MKNHLARAFHTCDFQRGIPASKKPSWFRLNTPKSWRKRDTKSYLLAKETHNSITCITDRLQYHVLEKISQKIHRRYQPLPFIHPVIHHGAPLASPVATNAPAPNAKEPRPLQGGRLRLHGMIKTKPWDLHGSTYGILWKLINMAHIGPWKPWK